MNNEKINIQRYYMTWKNILYIATAILGFCCLYFYKIDLKAIHHDESINGWKLIEMGQIGYYAYDSANYHGPFFFYFQKIYEILFGINHNVIRAGAATFSILTWLTLITWGILRKNSLKWLGVLFGLGSASLFFGRSGIHESTFVFFQVLSLIGFLEWKKYHNNKGLKLLFFAFIGGLLNKETYVITLLASLLSLAIEIIANRQSSRCNLNKFYKDFKNTLGLKYIFVGFIIIIIFYTGFGQNLSGLTAFIRSHLVWLNVGMTTSGHTKEFLYWTKLILQYEFITTLGFIVAIYSIFKFNKTFFLATFALGNWLIYSLIPYKTPWCLISITWPFLFVLSDYIDIKFHYIPKKQIWIASAFIIIVELIRSYPSVYREPLDYQHPYVYAQTRHEIKKLMHLIENKKTFGKSVISFSPDIWPLPYLLYKNPHYQFAPTEKSITAQDRDNILMLIIDKSLTNADLYEYFQGWFKKDFIIRNSREATEIFFNPNYFNRLEIETLNSSY